MSSVEPPAPGTLLFVYGTLLTVSEHPMGALLRAHSDLVGKGSIRACLYMIDDPDQPGQNTYPGALPSGDPDDDVFGEVYRLREPDKVLPAFDDFEACSPRWPEPHEFVLRRVPVTMENGETLQAVSYLYSWDVSKAERIVSGRFTQVASDVQ